VTTCTTNAVTQRNEIQPLTTQIAAFVAAVVNLPERAIETAYVWQQRTFDRRHLQNLDDRTLSDMGLSRADADHEAAKPFWIS
jgi:uncharacterized protein YjiS (DUF1127 family)